MKYKYGKELSYRQAQDHLCDGGVILNLGTKIRWMQAYEYLNAKNEWTRFKWDGMGPFYEAFPDPEYDLTFMEAWDKAKAGHTIEHEKGIIVRYGPNTAISYGLYAVGQSIEPTSFWLDAKYRVVDPA